MVKPFQFARLPKIIFGKGTIVQLPGMINKFGHSIILVTGVQSFLCSDPAKLLLIQFEESGTGYRNVSIPGEPSPEMIDQVAARFRGEQVSAVVGIGGGSVLDAGKAISAMLGMEEPVMEFLEGVGTKEHPGTKVPYIAVPTTSGTGSEATPWA